MNKRFKKNYPKIVLMLLIVGISMGYAALTSNLRIIGASDIYNTRWDVHWNNVQVTSGSVSGGNVTTAAHILTGATEVEYSITLSTPGDFYEFTVDAVNAGTIDAMIGSFSNKVYQSNGTTERTLPDYLAYTVLYSDGVVVGNNHKLSANSTETYKVRVEFKKNINANQLPSSQDTLVFKFNVSYVQADDNGINKPSPYVYTTNVFDGIWSTLPTETNTSVVWLGQPISNGITTYQTPAQALGENSDSFAFLKHRLTNNIVTESYAGFIITDAMAQANPGMTAGTYYLKGRKTKEYVNGSWQCMSEYDDGNGNCIDPGYNTNKATLISAFGSSNCTESPEEFYCHSGSNSFIFSAYAHPSGIVESFDDLDCMVSDEGFSGCYEFW